MIESSAKALISYARTDAKVLEGALLPALERLNVSYWYDKKIHCGDIWIDEVVKRIATAQWIIVVLCPKYLSQLKKGNGACSLEASWIINHIAQSRSPCRLIPILASGTRKTSVPLQFGAHQYIDDGSDPEKLYSSLKSILSTNNNNTRNHASGTHRNDIPDVEPPIVDGPENLPELARYHFHTVASRYDESLRVGNAMQAENTVVLLSLLDEVMKNRIIPHPKAWVDAGCGTGLVASIAFGKKDRHRCCWLHNSETRIAFDYAPGMLCRLPGDRYTHSFEADIRTITPEILSEHTDCKEVDLIIANNVFHWLFTESEIAKAFRQCKSILRVGGILAASIAGAGTGRYFLESYSAEMTGALNGKARDLWKTHIENPIGLLSLDKVVKIARDAGFVIEVARLVFEPRDYEGGTDGYVDDAQCYGDSVYMAPLLMQGQERRKEVWDQIKRRFKETHEAATNRASGYQHDQYMIYLVVRRSSE